MMKVYDELYVGIRNYKDGFRHAFATPVEANAAFQKRKKTVDDWTNITYGGNKQEHIIIANNAKKGFKVGECVTRYRTSNRLFRVTDPDHDFDVEIASENLSELLSECTIIKGEIQDKCYWARNGAQNWLVTENDSRAESASSINMKKRTVQPGDIFLRYNFKHLYLGPVTYTKFKIRSEYVRTDPKSYAYAYDYYITMEVVTENLILDENNNTVTTVKNKPTAVIVGHNDDYKHAPLKNTIYSHDDYYTAVLFDEGMYEYSNEALTEMFDKSRKLYNARNIYFNR